MILGLGKDGLKNGWANGVCKKAEERIIEFGIDF